MKHLAVALIDVLAFVETCEDDVLDSDSAVEILESAAHELAMTSKEERNVLRMALDELIAGESAGIARVDRLQFYESFMEHFNLED